MNGVKNDYIEKALDELAPVLGVREFIDEKKFISLLKKRETECIEAIALHLGLPIKINISWVPRGYQSATNTTASHGFQSTNLVTTEKDNHGIYQGSGGITAQVLVPPNLPLYGSPNMVNFPINVRLSMNNVEDPVTLIGIMAHELSHILLRSLLHREKENEFYTDLTAMLLGFAKTMRKGRRVVRTNTSTKQELFYGTTTTTHTETTTYGYLSDDNFDFAFNRITEVLQERKSEKEQLLEKVKQFKGRLGRAEKALGVKSLSQVIKKARKIK